MNAAMVFGGMSGLWSLGVLFSLVAAMFDGQMATPMLRQDALTAAAIWPLVLLPWRDWLGSSRPGSHRRVTA